METLKMTEKTQICAHCGDKGRCYEHEGRQYCGVCARGLLTRLKNEYFKSGDASLGWKIDDLWRQIVFEPHNPEYDEFRLEDANWLEEMENEGLGEDAKQLVRDFVEEHLDGELERLKEFNLSTLEKDDKYGQQKGQRFDFDADDCLLARAVYVLVWGDVFPHMNMQSVGSGRAYRGDTMNTFHTMFGREIPERPGFFCGLENFHPNDKMRELARKFHELVPTIGNYVIIPNHADRWGRTINTYRGRHHLWHDYFDQFMVALEAVLADGPKQDDTLRTLVQERNHFAFEKYKGSEGFRKLSESLFLDEYIEKNGHAFIFSTSMNDKVMYHWMTPPPSDEEYQQGATLYAQNAIKIIHSRAERIVSTLSKKL